MSDYPSLTKSWLYSVNQFVPVAATALAQDQNVLWAVYQSLLGLSGGTLGANAWTVVSSSGFGSASALTWAANGSTHSWVVLKQTGIGSNFQVLISCSNASHFNLNVYVSPSVGFTSGTSTTDPTAADSSQLLTNAAFGVFGDTRAYRIHALQSSDGACTRILICSYSNASNGGVCSGYLSLELAKNPVTGWTYPAHSMWLGSSSATQVLTYANLASTTYSGYSRAAANLTLIWTGEGITNNQINQRSDTGSIPNAFNQKWHAPQIGLYSNTVGSKGQHGGMFDIWWGPAYAVQFYNYASFDGASPNSFAQFGAVVFPWPPGTLPLWN